MTFREWHKEHYGWDSDDAEYAKFRGEYRIRHNSWLAGIEEGRRQERKECALIAQSFQIAHCKSHHDDAVNMTATLIKEEILERDAIRAEGK